MSNRIDVMASLLGSEVELTGKVMPNGEIRRRVRLGDVTIHITETRAGGWQEAHFHKGLRETYTVINGAMAFVSEDCQDDSRRYIAIHQPTSSVTTSIEDAHNVYLYPDTTIVTVVYGEPVGNPDKKGNDWWPASETFNSWTKSLSGSEIRRLVFG